MYIYAQLDKDGICIGVSNLSGEVNDVTMVRMDTYTFDVLGKRYVNGEWQDVPKEPIPPEPTQKEILQEKLSKLSDKLDRQSTILMDLGMTLMAPPEVPDTPPDLPPMPPTGTLPSTEELKGMMGGMTPPDLPTP